MDGAAQTGQTGSSKIFQTTIGWRYTNGVNFCLTIYTGIEPTFPISADIIKGGQDVNFIIGYLSSMHWTMKKMQQNEK